jgi:hypothetical protein
MASRPYTPTPRGKSSRHSKHERNAQWRRDRRYRASRRELALALTILPSLPRPFLCRLTARTLDRLDD